MADNPYAAFQKPASDPYSAFQKPADSIQGLAPGQSLPGMHAAPKPAELTRPDDWQDKTKDVLGGMGRGVLHTVGGVGDLVTGGQVSPMIGNLDKPMNGTQALGRNLEQASEYLIPTGAEEGVVKLGAKFLPKVPALFSRMAGSALVNGLHNKVQGGDFTTGAAAGAGGELLGAGLQTIAPKLAEKALGIKGKDMGYGKTPGTAALEETKGFAPKKVAKAASDKLGQLTPELDAKVAASSNTADLAPAKKVIDDSISTAHAGNGSGSDLVPMQQQLTEPGPGFVGATNPKYGQGAPSQILAPNGQPVPGLPQVVGSEIADQQAPTDLLRMKRQFGQDFIGNWNPMTHTVGAKNVAKQAYGKMGESLEQAVPEAADLNQRISSLIPVKQAASKAALATIGGGLGATLGGAEGFQHGGLKGGLEGAAVGALGGGLLGHPATGMAAARVLYSPTTRQIIIPAARGLGLQLNRPEDKQQ